MPISLHPSACASFDNKAQALLQHVKPLPIGQSYQANFPSDVPIAASIKEDEIIGEIEESTTDYKGNTVSRCFYIDGVRYGLMQEAYGYLKDLAASICSVRSVRDTLSTSYIGKVLFDWVKGAFSRVIPGQSFCDALISQAEKEIVETTAWVPIANLEIEEPFFIGPVELRPVSRTVVDGWEKVLESIPETYLDNAKKMLLDLRNKFQGRAAAVIKVKAERRRAFEISIEQAQLTASMFALFSPASLLPDIKCLSTISGSEALLQGTVIFSPEGKALHVSSSVLDIASARPWKVSCDEIEELKKSGLGNISALLSEDDPNEFKKAILNALILYSKAAFTSDPVEKVIYVLSSLESMLLKNENEPIQQNLAERIAIFTANELAKRKEIISNIKSTYGVRSRYLHHGHLRSEIETVREFLMNAWVFYRHLLEYADKFSTRLDFVSAIDDAKLS